MKDISNELCTRLNRGIRRNIDSCIDIKISNKIWDDIWGAYRVTVSTQLLNQLKAVIGDQLRSSIKL